MKRARIALLAATVAIATIAASVTATAQRRNLDFTLVNQTGLTVVELYVSPTKDATWGEDVLGRDVLNHQEKADITFSRSETTCMWDLKIVDEDEDEVEWENLNLCEASEITLKYERGTPTAIVK